MLIVFGNEDDDRTFEHAVAVIANTEKVISSLFKRAENGLGQAEFIELCQNISFMGPERRQGPRARTNGFSVWKPA